MKDHEFAELPHPPALSRPGEIRRVTKPVRMLVYWGWSVVFTIALIVVVLELFVPMPSLRAPDELMHAEYVVSKAAHQLAIRSDCNETASLLESAIDALPAKVLGLSGTISASPVVTDASQATTTESSTEGSGETVPILTRTALSTIYSVQDTSNERTLTSTTVGTVTVTVSPVQYTESSVGDDSCNGAVTETVSVTVYSSPEVTVTAGASTITDLNTEVSYTSDLPDVTLSGDPSTYTAVHTEVTYTTGAPDATVSQDPATVTRVQTEVSVTSGLPDATVPGDPSTVTDIQVSWSWPLTSTYATPVTTVTITDLWFTTSTVGTPPGTEEARPSTFTTIISSQVTVTVSSPNPEASSEVAGEAASLPTPSPTRTYSEIVTVTDGPPVIETTTVDVFPPSYSTSYNATSTSPSSIATPIVISGGSKSPRPRGWGGGNGNGSGNVACTVMLIAVFMFML